MSDSHEKKPYRVFLSAASRDLKSLRVQATKMLEEKGTELTFDGRPLEVVVQETFPPDFQSVWEILRQKIISCDAVVCLVGFAYGNEPQNVPPGWQRRSYTQMEYDIGHTLKMPVFVFRADDQSALDKHPGEEKDLQKLQADYREEIRGHDRVRNLFSTSAELFKQLLQLKFPEPRTLEMPENLPYPSLGTLFKGRDDFLKTLREKLGRNPGRAVGVLATQTLHGLGGIGKTRLAVEYAWKHRNDYTALLFITADTPENLNRNLAELTGPLVLDLKEVQGVAEEEVRVRAALDWLKTHPGWFLIVDNVDDEKTAAAVEKIVKSIQSGNVEKRGHVIITSRLKDWGAGVEPLELNVLSSEAAEEFLEERTAARRPHQPDDAEAIAELAECLDGLALALEQAGAYISHTRCPIRAYLKRWKEQAKSVLTWHDELQMKYPKSIAVTWQTTWEQLQPASRRLMEVLGWLSPEPIPEFLFEGEDSEEIVNEILEQEDLWLTLADLERYSFINRDVETETNSFQIHRLVQEITRLLDQNDGENHLPLLRAYSLFAQLDLDEPEDSDNWVTFDIIAPHADTIIQFGVEKNEHHIMVYLIDVMGRYYMSKARLQDSEFYLRMSFHLCIENLGCDNYNTVSAMNQLGLILQYIGQYEESSELLRKALILEEKLSSSPEIIIIRMANLATTLQLMGELAEAEELTRTALKSAESVYGESDPEVARVSGNLAQILLDLGRVEEAELLNRRSLAIDKSCYGRSHAFTALRLNNLGHTLLRKGDLSEAEMLFLESIKIKEDLYGNDHPEVAIVLNNLGELYRQDMRLLQAEMCFRRSLDIFENSYPDNSIAVATAANNIARICINTSRHDESEPFIDTAYEIYCNLHDECHPSVGLVLVKKLELHAHRAELEQVELLFDHILEIFLNFEKQTEHPHPLFSTVIQILEGALRTAGFDETVIRDKFAVVGIPRDRG